MKTALIAGATGLVGNELLNLLVKDEQYGKIIVLVRKALSLNHPKVVVKVVDFDSLHSHAQVFENVDDVFCCLGTTIKKAETKEAFRKVDFTYPVELATLAEKKNVTHFLVITAMGADLKSSIFYNRVKGEVEEEIGKLKIKAISFFRPSLLIGNRMEKRRGERIGIVLAKLLGFLFIGPLKNYKAIQVRKVAAAMLKQASNDAGGVKVILSGEMQSIPL